MSNINAQTIINEAMAAHAIAPNEYTWGDKITFRTSARGSHRILNCKENLQRFADLVRKNAAAFGGGLVREEKAKPAIVWPSKTISLFKQCMEDNDYQAAFDIGTGKLGALFFIGRENRAYMQVAPVPCETMPGLVSVLCEDGKYAVIEPVSMLACNGQSHIQKKSRDAQIENCQRVWDTISEHTKARIFTDAESKRVDQSAARAQWLADHGIIDDAAIEARIEANAAQDVAEIVAQAHAVSAIAEAMAPAAAEPPELVTCEAGESEAQESSTGSASTVPAWIRGCEVGSVETIGAYVPSFTPVPDFQPVTHTVAVSADTSHLLALMSRMDNERARLEDASSSGEREARAVIVAQIEKEIQGEYAHLRMPQSEDLPAIDDDALLAELTPPTPPAETQAPTTPAEIPDCTRDIPLSLAVNAYHGVSMSPERRGANAQAEYAQSMAQDYETMRIQAVRGGTIDLLPDVFARYRGRQAGAYRAYLASSSRCVSSFIAGPSNFPSARMNKRSDIAHRRLTEYLDGGKMALQAAIRTLRPDLRAIMAGDADAIDRLTIELANAERAHEQMKEANKAIRANAEAGESHQVAALMELGFNEQTAVKLLHPMRPYCKGFEGFTLTNSSANIRRLKGRLEQITAAKARPVETVECSNGVTLEDDAPANRVRLFFPGKPDEAIRTELKSNGFRWAPSIGAWQAYRNHHTLTTAKRMAGEPAPAEDVPEVEAIEPTTPPMEIAQDAAPAAEPVPVVEIEGTTQAAEIQPEPVAPVVEIEAQQVTTEPAATPDDTQKFRVRAKSGEWRASFMMIGTMYALLFNGDGSKVTTTTYATHQERMQALEAMARATTPPDTPPDGGLPIATVDAPTDAPTPPVAECTPGATVAVSSASDAPLHPRNIIPTNGLHIVDDAFEAWTSQHQYPSGARFFFVMYLGKSAKPWKYYGYSTEAKRDDGFQRHATEAREIAAFKAKRKAEDMAKAEQGHGLQVGDVVRSSWGYDQTNVNHYQIIKLIGKSTVEVRELAEHEESTGCMTGRVAPVWGEFIGEPMRRTVDKYGDVNILREKFGRASKIEPVAIVHGVRCYASTGYSSYA